MREWIKEGCAEGIGGQGVGFTWIGASFLRLLLFNGALAH